MTCGSVDDGKSTLIGRLLWDSKLVSDDQLATLESESKRVGTQHGEIDYALLVDGLQAERENRASRLMWPIGSLLLRSGNSLWLMRPVMNNILAIWRPGPLLLTWP